MRLPDTLSRFRGSILAVAIAAFVSLLGAVAANASVPQLMNYQGFLADNAGNPANGSYTLKFTLYPDSLTGAPLWSETYSGVTVSAGVFNVLLGSVSPLSTTVLDGHKLWLLTTVNGTDVLPRRPIVSVAYALRAAVADSAVRAGSVGGDIVGQVQINCGSGTALVYIPGRSFVAYTASDGTFDLSGVPAGTYNLHIEAPGSGSTNVTNVVVSVPGFTNVGVIALGANTATDPNNCGSCGHVCSGVNGTPTCVAGNCQITCNAGFFDCNGMPADGCEVNVLANVNNCGGCGNVCPPQPNANSVCSNGSCAYMCVAGFSDCNGTMVDGCEVSILSDPNNCGGCGHACGSGHACVNGTCQ